VGSPAPTRAYHHGNLRQALVNAGLARLEQKRGGELSLRELARTVGVSANASYRHFGAKGDLLQALAAEGFRRLIAAQARAATGAKDPMERHRAAGRAYVKFAMANPALFRLMLGHSEPKPTGELKSTSEFAFQALRASAAHAMSVPVDDERATVAAIRAWSLAHGLSQIILAGHLDEFGPDLDPLIDAVLRPVAR
jgi:AcrR family transcriptional regulator